MEILGVRIDELTCESALSRVAGFFDNKSVQTVFTPNPEMLVDASNDRYFRDVLNSGTLNICDGKGTEIVSKGKLKRIPGADFMLEICRLAEKRGKTIFLLGSGSKKNIDEAGINLKKEFPNLRISGVHPGIDIKLEGERVVYNSEDNDFLLDSIIEASPDILFVGFGHGKQEKWIYENQKHLPSVRLIMGVGGAFDFISGKIRRAPRLFRYFGLEWLWRLLVQPWRIGRIWKATIVFIFYNIHMSMPLSQQKKIVWLLLAIELYVLSALQQAVLWFVYFYSDLRYWISIATGIISFVVFQRLFARFDVDNKYFVAKSALSLVVAGAVYVGIFVFLSLNKSV